MPTTINIWEDAKMEDKGASTGGTWTYEGDVSPAPTPPVTYNGTADFSGVTEFGDFPFKYEVTSGGVTTSNIYTVEWAEYDVRVNDDCSGAIFIPLPGSIVSNFDTFIEDNLASSCPGGCASATDSGTTKPSEWGSGSFEGDIWYHTTLPSKSSLYYYQVIVDGTSFGEEGIVNPLLELWSGTPADDCLSITSFAATKGGGKQAALTGSVPSSTPQQLRIRISANLGNAGKFKLTIRTV